MPASQMRCWLVGGTPLLQECAEILLARGHEVAGVVTSAGALAEWARARGLQPVDARADWAAALEAREFDCLFSIGHLALIPPRVLRLPRRAAINFHDGPLPDFAGLHAPAWALIEGASRYGITWHLLDTKVDAGAIVARRPVEIGPGDTSLSLNVKCFEAALDSFGPLVDELADGRLRPEAQDQGRRRYFGRQARPPAAAVLDWARPAAELEALVRALDFGRHPNPLGLPRLSRGAHVLGVTAARAGDDGEGGPAATATAPGAVLALDATSVRVATGRGALELTGFVDLAGRPLTAAEVATRLALAPGVALEGLEAERARRLGELDRRVCGAEAAWVERLSDLQPVTLPFPRAAATTPGRPAAAALDAPAALSDRFPGRPPVAVLGAALALYLSRLCRRRVLDLGHRGPALRAATEGLEPWVAARVPLRVEVRPDEPLAPLVERVASALEEADGLGPLPRDLVARHPVLHGSGLDLDAGADGRLLPVAIEQVERFGEPALPVDAEWALEIESATGACRCVHRLDPAAAESLRLGLLALLQSVADRPSLPGSAHPLAGAADRERQLVTWNRTARPFRREALAHVLVAEQARRTPDAIAVSCEGRTLSYAELARRATALGGTLRAQGAGRGRRVGLHLERSLELPVAMLAILDSGAAYVPLDPALPPAALAVLIEDSQLDLVLTHSAHEASLPAVAARRVYVDGAGTADPTPTAGSNGAPPGLDGRAPGPEDAAYVIYTSGSTGRPKGVVVRHRNLAGFFAAMDAVVPHDPPGTWLAVTSPSFDISLLELLWTLAHGFKVVLSAGPVVGRRLVAASTRGLDFSLFYFANDEGAAGGDGYRLLLEGARFADAHGWRAVWTPERHFHAFGGLYPNPAVAGAALAAVTRRVEIRAGSVVLPLHHPIRIAEEWALVDNLSGGRVGVSFASGWHPADFVLAARPQAESRASFARDIDRVRRLWRGETLEFTGPDGTVTAVATRPRPVQPELPVWVTAAGNSDTFVEAGRIGAHVLTHLLGQSEEELEAKIALYREARARAGLDPATGIVSLVLHAYLGDDERSARERARGPLLRYLDSSLSMTSGHAPAFPAFRRPADGGAAPAANGRAAGDELSALDASERGALLDHAAERYLGTAGLIGTPAGALERVQRLRARGVDEIACLVDFGLPTDEVLAALPRLEELRRRAQPRAEAGASLAELVEREGVSHLQCTPSMARMLCADLDSRAALGRLRHLFVGGEACPAALARELRSSTRATITNMYGPTETTVWSSTHALGAAPDGADVVPIGRPIANTRLYVVDEALEPLPTGAAGELVIGGEGVAAGYLGRPELEAERFVPDRFSGEPGARLYRTGDLARFRPDGVLEFLGRTDHQIKIRGRRVEPAEIEALLEQQPAVAEAVVVAREDTPGDLRLVAYVVAGATAPEPAALRAALADRLPDELVPARFVVLPRLPRTPNGKLDRRALPAPPASGPADGADAVPQGEMETRLARLWQEVLGVERVGVESNFFDLGGHSLLVVRILRRLPDLTPKRVSLTDLFRFPTIRALARFLVSGDEPLGVDPAALERGRRRRRWMQQSRPGAGGP